MNSKICTGLVFTKPALEAVLGGDMKIVDPDNLVKSLKEETWEGMVIPEGGFPDTEAGGIARCRSWYDANKFDAPFCCQFVGEEGDTLEDMDSDGWFVPDLGTESAEPLDYGEDGVFTPHAISFKGAERLAGLTALAAAAMVWSN